MFPITTPRAALLVALALGSAACGQESPTSNVAPPPSASALAPTDGLVTVNGAVIGNVDLKLRLKNDSHEADAHAKPDRAKAVLDTIIRQELMAQRAVELGLETDPKYQEGLHQMEAQVNAFKRKELAELFVRREIEKKAEITDEEARKVFDANASRFRTELRISQILQRSEAAIGKVQEELKQGTPFEEVAAKRVPPTPDGQKPWDLGYMSWNKMPPAWRGVVFDMKPGEVSGIMRGPNDRFWIVKVVDVRETPDVTFESVKAAIMADQKGAKIDELRERTERELRAKAKIAYSKTVPAVPSDDE